MAETSAPKVFKKQDMITVAEFASRLGVSRRHAYNLVDKGQAHGGVLAFRYGLKRALRIPITELERLRRVCMVEDV